MLAQFGMSIPVIAAPMAGGATTPAMVFAAARAGALGMLAAGYQTVAALDAEITSVRAEGVPFGVSLFAPNPLPVNPAAYREYAAALAREADQFGLTLPAGPTEDDDEFDEKIALLLDDPVPMVSFTFGIPPHGVIAALRRVDTIVVQTVTNADEAAQARDAGVDALAVQRAAAGGHSGTLSPREPLAQVPLVDLVERNAATVPLPILAAGGLATPGAVAEVIRAGAAAAVVGAAAAVVGTALLRADESGASAPPTGARWSIPLTPRRCSPMRSPDAPLAACATRSSTSTNPRRRWASRHSPPHQPTPQSRSRRG